MKNGQEFDTGEVQLTTVQKELIKETTTSEPAPKSVQGSAPTVARDAQLRRAVYDAIVQLSDIVSEDALKMLLPFLHCTAWDEVIEERYLGSPRLCGFPVCGEIVEARVKKQRYHIDRAACKIYEHRSETDMYCSRFCLLRSASVRSQLPDEPLWLSGNISKRMSSTYRTEGPSELGNQGKKREIEIVRAAEEKLNDLIIREAESSSQSEAEDEENETDVKHFLDGVSNILGAEQLEESTQEMKNTAPPKVSPNAKIRQSSSKSPTVVISAKAPPVIHNPRLPDPQMSSEHTFTRAEIEKLSRLRSKYSGRGSKKPVLVDPAPLTPSTSKTHPLDGIVADPPKPSQDVDTNRSCNEAKFIEDARVLFKGWVTDRTRQLLRSGGLCLSDTTSSVMKQFFRPFSDDVTEMNEFVLPSVDSIDVRKKRLHIFLESVKKPLAVYQRELEFSFSEFNWLYVLAATFTLEANTITNFSNDVLKLVCALLLKLISLLDTSVEDSIFPEGKVADRFVRSLANLDVDLKTFDSIISEILGDEKISV
ncbi:hypothetical protein RB195_009348 [Necator americanus]